MVFRATVVGTAGVALGRSVGSTIGLFEATGADVCIGVGLVERIDSGVEVFVGPAVNVLVGVTDGVLVNVGVFGMIVGVYVDVGVAVDVDVDVDVGAAVGVEVGVGVGVGVGVPKKSIGKLFFELPVILATVVAEKAASRKVIVKFETSSEF